MQKIMIVEDDEVIASAIQKHLETWNYEVYVIDDFEHVLEKYVQIQPELILLDISLPFYNGYHLSLIHILHIKKRFFKYIPYWKIAIGHCNQKMQ